MKMIENITEKRENTPITFKEKNHFLYLKQKAMLDTFLHMEQSRRQSVIKVCTTFLQKWEKYLTDLSSLFQL